MALGPLGGIVGFQLNTLTSNASGSAIWQQINGQACQLMFFSLGNNNAVQRFLKLCDSATVPSLNTTGATSANGIMATYQFEIPGNAAGAGSNLAISNGPPMMSGLQFTNGLWATITANQAIADNSGISGVNDAFGVIGFR
jgi:hypothetical protein